MDENDFVSVKMFAKRTSLGERTVRRLIAEGQIGFLRVGRRVLIRYEDAIHSLAWLAEEADGIEDRAA